MKILHLLWDGRPDDAQRYVEGLVTSDLWAGVEHAVCCAGRGDWLAARLDDAGFSAWHELGLTHPWALHRLREPPRSLAGWDPDVVHVHHDLPALSMLASRFPRARRIFSEHGDGLWRHGRGAFGGLLRRVTGPLWDAVLAGTKHSGQALVRQVPCLASCLLVLPTPHFGEVAATPVPPSRRARLVAAHGPLTAAQGADRLIDAALFVRSVRDDVRFAIHGDGPERLALVRRASRLGLAAEALQFDPEGITSDHSFEQAWATVLPTPHETGRATALRSLAEGTPVIGSARTGLGEVVRHGEEGLLVAPGDATALARAVLATLDDPRAWDAMAHRARRRAELFDADTHICALEVVYAGELVGSEFGSGALMAA